MNMRVAPCGHPGEPIIGTFVRCLQGCDSKPSGRGPTVVVPVAPEKLDYLPMKLMNKVTVWMTAAEDIPGHSLLVPVGQTRVCVRRLGERDLATSDVLCAKGTLVPCAVYPGTMMRQYRPGQLTWDTDVS